MRNITYTLLMAACICACNQPATTGNDSMASADTTYQVKAGGTKMIKVDGKYNVWTKKVGDGKIKVLLLHGGPGFSHDYMECFEDFLPKEGIEFYYYDQLGCGNSDAPTDTTLWNIPRYVEEVEQVRKGLGLDNFYLLGHSWGSMLAMEYLQKYQNHVKGAVLTNMTANKKNNTTNTASLKTKFFTAAERAKYDSLDKAKKYDSQEFQDLLMNKLYTHVICQLPVDKWPAPLMTAFKKANM